MTGSGEDVHADGSRSVRTAGPPDESSAAALHIGALSKTYRRPDVGAGIEAIERLDLEVCAEELVAVVGASGCGKSTLLKIVAGLVPASAGEVRVHGTPVTGPAPDLGMVFQAPTLLPWRTALDNVLLPIDLMGGRPQRYRDRARELLEQVGLADFVDRRPAELSGGMQQRVALCRALVHEPALLLMDEPFSALDEFTREALNDLLLELWRRRRKTILYVTHSVGEAVYLADRVVVLSPRPARVLADVAVSLRRPRVPEIRYEQPFLDVVRHVRDLLRGEGDGG